jgi:hypothetical protein
MADWPSWDQLEQTSSEVSWRLQGYTFLVRTRGSGYTVQTAPINRDRTRFRSYYSDQSLVIHESCGPGLATALSDKLGSKQ